MKYAYALLPFAMTAFAYQPLPTTLGNAAFQSAIAAASSSSVSAARARESAILNDALAGVREGEDAQAARAAVTAYSMSVEAARAEASKDASVVAAAEAAVATSMAAAQDRVEASLASVAVRNSISAEKAHSMLVVSASAAAAQHTEDLMSQARRVAQAAAARGTPMTSTVATVTPMETGIPTLTTIVTTPSTTVTISIAETSSTTTAPVKETSSPSSSETVMPMATAKTIQCSHGRSHCPKGMFCASKEVFGPRGVCVPLPKSAPACGGMEGKKCVGENVCVPNPLNGCTQIYTDGSCEGMCVRRDGKPAASIA